jgi:hypothetical protein
MTQRMFSALGATADRETLDPTDASCEHRETLKRKDPENPHRGAPGRMQRNPVRMTVGALAIGSVLGWMLRRR